MTVFAHLSILLRCASTLSHSEHWPTVLPDTTRAAIGCGPPRPFPSSERALTCSDRMDLKFHRRGGGRKVAKRTEKNRKTHKKSQISRKSRRFFFKDKIHTSPPFSWHTLYVCVVPSTSLAPPSPPPSPALVDGALRQQQHRLSGPDQPGGPGHADRVLLPVAGEQPHPEAGGQQLGHGGRNRVLGTGILYCTVEPDGTFRLTRVIN